MLKKNTRRRETITGSRLRCVKKGQLDVLKMYREIGDSSGVAMALNNIGGILDAEKKYEEAGNYYRVALKMREESGEMEFIPESYQNLSRLSQKNGKYDEALSFSQKGLEIAEKLGALEPQREARLLLSEIYELKHNTGMALKQYKSFVRLRDSIDNKENTRKNLQAEMNFEFDKQRAAEQAEQDKKDAVAAEAARKQRIVLWLAVSGCALMMALVVFIYRSNLQKQKANTEILRQKQVIETQKNIVEEKKKKKKNINILIYIFFFFFFFFGGK